MTEIIIPLVFLIFISSVILSVVSFARTTVLKRKIERIERLLENSVPAGKIVPEKPAEIKRPEPEKQTEKVIPPSSQEPVKEKTKVSWESFIGGRALNIIGAVALIIGMGFFLKYAFDNNWLTPPYQVAFGFVLGSVCVASALFYSAKNYKAFSYGLAGAGISILYLSSFAAYGFYLLLPYTITFLLMAGVTALSFWIALKLNSVVVSLLAWTGGFITPLLLDPNLADPTGIFTYIILLNAGVVLIIRQKPGWRTLEFLSLSVTWLLYFVWFIKNYSEKAFIVSLIFIHLVWGAYAFLNAFYDSTDTTGKRKAGIISNGVFFFTSLYFLSLDTGYELFLFMILPAAGYFLLQGFGGKGAKTLDYPLFSNMGLLFIAAALYVRFDSFTAIAVLSFYLLTAFIIADVKKLAGTLVFLRWALGALILLMLFQPGFLFGDYQTLNLLFNFRSLALIAASVVLIYGQYSLDKNIPARKFPLNGFYYYAAAFLLFAGIIVEFNGLNGALTRYSKQMYVAAEWAFISVVLYFAGKRLNKNELRYGALAIFALAFLVVFIKAFSIPQQTGYSLLFNVRMLAALVTAASCFFMLRMSGSFLKGTPGFLLNAAFILIILSAFSGELLDYFDRRILAGNIQSSEQETLKNIRALSLSGFWLLYSAAVLLYGILKNKRAVRITAIALFGLSILKIFIYDLSFLDTFYRIFSFLALGIILISVSFLYQKYKDRIL